MSVMFGNRQDIPDNPDQFSFANLLSQFGLGGNNGQDLGNNSIGLGTGLGIGLNTGKTLLDGYLGVKQSKLAEKQFNATNKFAQANLDNQLNTLRGNALTNYNRSDNQDRLGTRAQYLGSFGLQDVA